MGRVALLVTGNNRSNFKNQKPNIMKTEERKMKNVENFLTEIKELAKKYEAKHFLLCCDIDEKFHFPEVGK